MHTVGIVLATLAVLALSGGVIYGILALCAAAMSDE